MTPSGARWQVRVAPRRLLLEKRLIERVRNHAPGETVVVVRSSEDARRLARRVGPGCAVTTLARFLGRAGPESIEDEDLLPGPVLQWLVESALPGGYRDQARQHLATVFLDAIHLLEENAIRPPYPGKPRTDAETHLEAAHRALLDGLEAHHEAGRFAAFERVSRSRDGPPRFHVAYPAARCVSFFGIDSLSPAEREAVLNVTPEDVETTWFLLARMPADKAHEGLAFTGPLLHWLGHRGEVERVPLEDDEADDEGRTPLLASLFSLSPPKKRRLPGVFLDVSRTVDDEADEADDAGGSVRAPPRDRLEEARRLLARVRALLDAGAKPHEIGVVVPGLADYSGLLEDLFAEYEVPAATSFRGSLRTSPPGSLVAALLDVLDSGLLRDSVLDLVAHPLAAFPVRLPDGSTRVLDATRLRVWLQEAGLNPRGKTGAGGWDQALESLRRRRAAKQQGDGRENETNDRWASFDAQLAALAGLVERLDALAGVDEPEAFLVTVRELLDAAGLRQGVHRAAQSAGDPAFLLAAHRGVVALLDQVEDAFSLGGPTKGASRRVREVLRRELAAQEVPLPVDPEQGVQVISWRNARGRAFSHLFVVGATQDALPERDEQIAVEEILGERFGRRLKRLDRAEEARCILHGILSDTAGDVVFSAPQYDKDAPLVRSVLLDELLESFDVDPAPVPDDRVYTKREAARVAVLKGRPLAALPRHAVAATGLVHERVHGLEAGLYTGRIDDPDVRALDAARPVVGRAAVSASRLSQFAKCAFRSFVTHGLRVQAPWVRDEEMDPRDKGGLLHEIVERYMIEAIKREGRPFRLDPIRRADHEALVLDVALTVIADNRRRSVAYQAFEESVLGGLPGASNPYSGAPRGLLLRFLDSLEAFEDGEGVLDVEVGFEPSSDSNVLTEGAGAADGETTHPVEVDTPAGKVHLRGRIDRLDRIRDGSGRIGLRVVEYKSGNVPAKELVRGGVEFQLPLYAWVAGLLHPESPVDEAVYHQMKRPRAEDSGIVKKASFTRGGKNDLDVLMEKTPIRLGEILTAQGAGRFPLTLLDEKEAGCDWCELRRGCGLRPEMTGMRRESARRKKREGAEVAGYVPDRLELPAAEQENGDGGGSG